MGEAPTSEARPRDTDRLRPSNLTARTVSLVEHTVYKFGVDPCPVRRGITAAVKCYVRKTRFSCVGNEQKRPITTNGTRGGFQYDEGKACFDFCFRVRLDVGLAAVLDTSIIHNFLIEKVKMRTSSIPECAVPGTCVDNIEKLCSEISQSRRKRGPIPNYCCTSMNCETVSVWLARHSNCAINRWEFCRRLVRICFTS